MTALQILEPTKAEREVLLGLFTYALAKHGFTLDPFKMKEVELGGETLCIWLEPRKNDRWNIFMRGDGWRCVQNGITLEQVLYISDRKRFDIDLIYAKMLIF